MTYWKPAVGEERQCGYAGDWTQQLEVNRHPSERDRLRVRSERGKRRKQQLASDRSSQNKAGQRRIFQEWLTKGIKAHNKYVCCIQPETWWVVQRPADQWVSALCWANPWDTAAKVERVRNERALLGKSQHPVCTEKSHLTNRSEEAAKRWTGSYFVHLAFQDTSSKVCRSLNNPEIARGIHSAFVIGEKVGTKEKE